MLPIVVTAPVAAAEEAVLAEKVVRVVPGQRFTDLGVPALGLAVGFMVIFGTLMTALLAV